MALANFGKKKQLDSYKVFELSCVGNYTSSTKNNGTAYKVITWFNTPETGVNDIKSNQVSFLDVPANITLNALELTSDRNRFASSQSTPSAFYNSYLDMCLNHLTSSVASPFPSISNGYDFVLFQESLLNVDDFPYSFTVSIPEGAGLNNVYQAVKNSQWGGDPNSYVAIKTDDGFGSYWFIGVDKRHIRSLLKLPLGTNYGASRTNSVSDILKNVIPFSDGGITPIQYTNAGTLLVEEVKITSREV